MEAKKLCISGLHFGNMIKIVEKFWEAGPSLVYMTCYMIGHEKMRRCGNRAAKCVFIMDHIRLKRIDVE